VRACESYIALLAVASIISVISVKIISFFKWVLEATENEQQPSFVHVPAFVFLILAHQNGLPDTPPDKRLAQLGKNSCLLVSAILLNIQNLAEKKLQTLAVSTNSKQIHIRALSVCFFLFAYSCGLLYFLWSTFSLGTWLIAVTIYSVEAMVKVIVILAVHGLTLWDFYSQETLWESYDDWVFYTQSFGNVVQFVCAVLLFLNGNFILFFEIGGNSRAMMIVLHLYWNIWSEAKSGWKIFWKRRTAALKVSSLQDATSDQIFKNSDVCPICYMNMSSAKRTRCSHLFHRSCLTKWLHKQDTCPICMESLHKVDAMSQTE